MFKDIYGLKVIILVKIFCNYCHTFHNQERFHAIKFSGSVKSTLINNQRLGWEVWGSVQEYHTRITNIDNIVRNYL